MKNAYIPVCGHGLDRSIQDEIAKVGQLGTCAYCASVIAVLTVSPDGVRFRQVKKDLDLERERLKQVKHLLKGYRQ